MNPWDTHSDVTGGTHGRQAERGAAGKGDAVEEATGFEDHVALVTGAGSRCDGLGNGRAAAALKRSPLRRGTGQDFV